VTIDLYSCLPSVRAVLLYHGKYDSVMIDLHVLGFNINGEWLDVAYDLMFFRDSLALLIVEVSKITLS
jgi:hypothetical protein